MPKHSSLRKIFNKTRKSFLRRVFTGLLLLSLFSILILVFITFFFSKSWFSGNFAEYLPADQTVAFMEIDLDSKSPAVQNLWKFFSKSDLIKPLQLDIYSSYIVPDYSNLKPLLQSKFGVAFLSINKNLVPVYYFKLKSGQNITKALTAFQIPNNTPNLETRINGQKLISFSGGNNLKVLEFNNSLIVSDNLAALDLISKVASDQSLALHNSPIYNQTASSITDQNLVFIYLDQRILDHHLLANQNYLNQNFKMLARFLPLFKVAKATALAIKISPDRLTLMSVTSIDSTLTKNKPLLNFPEPYQGKLIGLLGPNHAVLLGGRNLQYEYQRLSNLYHSRSNLDQAIFQGEMKSLFNHIFPENVSLSTDLLPLLQNEYVFAIDFNKRPSFTFISKLSDPSDFIKWENLLQKLIPKFARLSPVMVNVTLPDGTTGKSLVAKPDSIKIINQNIDGISVKVMGNPNNPNSLKLYSVYNQKLLIVTTNSQMISTIINNQKKSINLNYQNYLFAADEIAIAKLAPIFHKLGLPNYVQKDWISNLILHYSKKYQQGNIIDQINLTIN